MECAGQVTCPDGGDLADTIHDRNRCNSDGSYQLRRRERAQFIIITHSRKTMEIADRLYGVTMEEPGVSKLISIQLN